MRDSYLGTFKIIKLVGKNAVEVKLTKTFSRKHPVFLIILVKPYHQTDENTFPKRKEVPSPGKVVEEDSPGPVKRIPNNRKIKNNRKDHRHYLVRLKGHAAEK
ncbi:hypothetical protein O181_034422 [Austropuccinia psidii MF-1]|uniref:Uncharacterized protein n=1 Tax=Austropuccinia psidii MF-1 TaxID=1389203 RepID=A0A9Q3D379_9BASI|nr:hypothetical protein [Austropuccinia psidii MF-1]